MKANEQTCLEKKSDPSVVCIGLFVVAGKAIFYIWKTNIVNTIVVIFFTFLLF